MAEKIPQDNVESIETPKIEWGAEAEKNMTWKQADDWCKSQGKGWRLPTKDELVEALKNGMEEISQEVYWSSTPCPPGTGNGVYPKYYCGGNHSFNEAKNYERVRCVRNVP
ncbi:MAG: DUF1566 domain-containing protein [Patescibacteria group bacterium]